MDLLREYAKMPWTYFESTERYPVPTSRAGKDAMDLLRSLEEVHVPVQAGHEGGYQGGRVPAARVQHLNNKQTEPVFLTFMEPRNRFQGINSANLCSLAGRYVNPIPNRFIAPRDFLKIPALYPRRK
jgi:hypothetical protein